MSQDSLPVSDCRPACSLASLESCKVAAEKLTHLSTLAAWPSADSWVKLWSCTTPNRNNHSMTFHEKCP